MQNEIHSPLNCDIETGVCEVPRGEAVVAGSRKPIRLLYFTDPICSSCWGIEPQLRKLKQEYGHYFDIEYRMGGLLKSWAEYGGSDVNGPESVAGHWAEASAYYQMPINGDVWKEDPLHSSYPPAVAFKAAQLQGAGKAEQLLRQLKEMVFLRKVNITRQEHLADAARKAGLDLLQFEQDYKGLAKQLFEEDLTMTREWNVRGFPTIFFIDGEDNRFKVYGSKPYQVYEQALLKLIPGEVQKRRPSSYEEIFSQFDTVTLKEWAVFFDISLEEAERDLVGLEGQGKVSRIATHAGYIWTVMHSN